MRNLTNWQESPWRGLLDLQRNLDRVFDSAFNEEDAGFRPLCEMEETDSHYLMSVDLPGVSRKDINIEVKDGDLVISGERKNEKKTSAYSERYYGKFHRVLSLPTGIDAD